MARKTAPRTAGAHTVTRLDQARVLAHPLRLRLLEVFARGPCTTKQAAEALGEPPTRLYHHARALEKVGLIQLRSTRPNRGAVEKHYEAIARSFAVDPGLFGKGGVAAAGSTADLVFERARAEVASLLASGAEPPDEIGPLVSRIGIEGSLREVAAIKRDLLAFMERIQKRGKGARPKGIGAPTKGPTVGAALTLAFVPVAPLAPPRAPKGRAPRGKATR